MHFYLPLTLPRAQIKSALKKRLHEQDSSTQNAQKSKNETQPTSSEPQTKKRKTEGIIILQLIYVAFAWSWLNSNHTMFDAVIMYKNLITLLRDPFIVIIF